MVVMKRRKSGNYSIKFQLVLDCLNQSVLHGNSTGSFKSHRANGSQTYCQVLVKVLDLIIGKACMALLLHPEYFYRDHHVMTAPLLTSA